jgi:hypothetical protein
MSLTYGLLACAALLSLTGCGRKTDAAPTAGPPQESTAQAGVAPRSGSALPPQPVTLDARVALQRMVAAYNTLDSFQMKSDGDVELVTVAPQLIHQTTTLKFTKDPARLTMLIKDPLSGTQRFYADGRTVVHYYGVSNQFMRRSVPPGLKSIAERIDKDSPQVLSPVSFLMSKGLPVGIGTAAITGKENVDGKPALVIKGQFKPDYQRDLAKRVFPSPLSPGRGEFTLWLDANTYLLLKSRGELSWNGTARLPEVGTAFSNPRLTFTERTTEIIQNPQLASEEFRFIAPKGVKEVFVQSSGQK